MKFLFFAVSFLLLNTYVFSQNLGQAQYSMLFESNKSEMFSRIKFKRDDLIFALIKSVKSNNG